MRLAFEVFVAEMVHFVKSLAYELMMVCVHIVSGEWGFLEYAIMLVLMGLLVGYLGTRYILRLEYVAFFIFFSFLSLSFYCLSVFFFLCVFARTNWLISLSLGWLKSIPTETDTLLKHLAKMSSQSELFLQRKNQHQHQRLFLPWPLEILFVTLCWKAGQCLGKRLCWRGCRQVLRVAYVDEVVR